MNEVHDTTKQNSDEEDIDLSHFFEYMKSEKGHELASRVLKIFEDLKKVAIEKSTNHAKFERIIQVVVISIVITATSILTCYNHFDASLGVLFGTMVGYLFGKK